MVLYKHDIFENNVKTRTSFFNNIEVKEKVEIRNKVYVKESFVEIKEALYLLHYSRDKDVFSEEGKYFKLVAGVKVEIDIKEYKDLKKEYNYFVVIDVQNSKMYTVDTTETNLTVNIEVINKFFGKKIKALNEVDYKKLETDFKANTIKMSYKAPKQIELYGKQLDDDIKVHISDYYNADDITIILKNISSKKVLKEIAKTEGDTNVKFVIEATDQSGSSIIINNRSISMIEVLNEKNVKRMKIRDIKNDITNHFIK